LGLCEAVTTTPEWHFSSRMAKLNSGVGRSLSNRKTVNPFEAKMSATRSANIRELLRRIVADRHADPLAREILFQVVGEPLRGHAHRIDVHAVGTHAHDAAQAARTEFQILVKALGQLLPIVIHQIAHLLFGRFVVVAVEYLLFSVAFSDFLYIAK